MTDATSLMPSSPWLNATQAAIKKVVNPTVSKDQKM